MAKDQFDLIIDAIHAVRQTMDYHSVSVEGDQKIDEIVKILRGRAENLPVISTAQPLRVNQLALAVADAIHRTYGNGPRQQ